jgi:D-alanyl-D-alanine carboxypeptidase/D-alanyl-D-alanine-endopeptidase (penicillin-binding protein 4)
MNLKAQIFIFVLLFFKVCLSEGSLSSRIREALNNSGLNQEFVGIQISSLKSGRILFKHNPDRLFNPASNVKIITILSALSLLGPSYKFRTGIYADINQGVISDIYIKGFGDPSFTYKDLWHICTRLYIKGVRRIEGDVYVDDTFFDKSYLPPAYDQKPLDDAPYRAPCSAVSIDENTVSVSIMGAKALENKPRVWIQPSPSYVILKNNLKTISKGPTVIKLYASPFQERTKISLWGKVLMNFYAGTFRRRIENPSLNVGYAFLDLLKKVGIKAGSKVKIGVVPPHTSFLLVHHSLPLSVLLKMVGKDSNNFYAEQIFKTMGAEIKGAPGSWKKAKEVVINFLARFGLSPKKYVLKNGSGLFDANRFSASQFCTILRKAFLDFRWRAEFLASLAIAGMDGTVKDRFQGPLAKKFRVKTGTLEDVSALSGYMFSSTKNFVFSILINKAKGKIWRAHRLQNEILKILAQSSGSD